MRVILGAFLLMLAASGCQKYIPFPNSAADRIWLVTEDGTEVFRCWDLKNQTGKPHALCRRAEMVGKTETTALTNLAEGTAMPSHADNTETSHSVVK